MSAEVQRLRRAVIQTVGECRADATEIAKTRRTLPRYYRYPHLDYFDEGLPNVTHGDGPTTWSGLFGDASWHAKRPQDLASYSEMLAAIDDVPLAKYRLSFPVEESKRTWFAQMWLGVAAFGLLDRLMLTVGPEFTDEDADREWAPIERWLTSDSPLPAQLVVPLPMTSPESDTTHDLAPGIRLERIAEPEQLARAPSDDHFGASNNVVVAAATHALVFDSIEVPPNDLMLHSWATAQSYVGQTWLEETLQALRLASHLPLGYAQTYLRPQGWATGYTADLPPIEGRSTIRRYPPSFDHYRWLQASQRLTNEHLREAPELLAALVGASGRLRLAARRLSQAQLRSDEEDAVLDACIALEAGVGDRQAAEMTYKVSMRAATLLGEAGLESEKVRSVVRKLYNWRSAIVHGGDAKKARRDFAAAAEMADEHAVAGAFAVANATVRELLRRPDIESGGDIDSRMLPG